MTSKTKVLKGYKATYKSSGRKKYSWSKAIKSYKRTGFFKTKVNGSGHTAGYNWGEEKGIDPDSSVRRYGKNSPSFDEGVYQYKQSKKNALENVMK